MRKREAQTQALSGRVRMRWFAGVPIDTNPFIMRDLGIALLVLWPTVFLFVLGSQALLARAGAAGNAAGFSWNAAFIMALSLGTYVALGAVGAFLLIAAAVFGNRFVVMYRLYEDALYYETMRPPRGSAFLKTDRKPFPVEELLDPPASVSKYIALCDIEWVEPHVLFRMFELRGKKGMLARVYCPDEATYEKALACIAEAVRIS